MPSPLYVTRDRYLASFLCFRGATLESWKRVGPKKVDYRFVADEGLHDLLRLYWSEQFTSVIPLRLFATLHRIICLSRTRP